MPLSPKTLLFYLVDNVLNSIVTVLRRLYIRGAQFVGPQVPLEVRP